MSLGLLTLLAAAAAAPAPSPATARWVVKPGEQSCSLARETGGKRPLTMTVRTVPGTRFAEMWLLDPKWAGPTNLRFEPVELSLPPSGYRATSRATAVGSPPEGGIIAIVDEEFVKSLAGASALRIERGGRTLAQVATPQAAAAAASLKACEDRLMRRWGFDPEAIRLLRRHASQVVGAHRWFSEEDYPAEAVRFRQQGSVLTRLVIDTEGRVAECVVVDGSGYPELDRRTCEVFLSRGRFRPALSAAGEPVRDLAAVRIHWSLP